MIESANVKQDTSRLQRKDCQTSVITLFYAFRQKQLDNLFESTALRKFSSVDNQVKKSALMCVWKAVLPASVSKTSSTVLLPEFFVPQFICTSRSSNKVFIHLRKKNVSPIRKLLHPLYRLKGRLHFLLRCDQPSGRKALKGTLIYLRVRHMKFGAVQGNLCWGNQTIASTFILAFLLPVLPPLIPS